MSKLKILIILLLVAALLVATVTVAFAGGKGWGRLRSCRRGKVENKKHCQAALVLEEMYEQSQGFS